MTDFLTAKWENLIMANYAVHPEVLLPYLPSGTDLDFYNCETFVSLVGFMFKKTKIFGIPIPFFGTFEEVNLRFYVTRLDGNIKKRGVVFINETVPSQLVASIANYLYKEHYISIPTKHTWEVTDEKRRIEYNWKMNHQWNKIFVDASSKKNKMKKGSFEEFIFEHYFGYTKINSLATEEYQINHAKWDVHQVNNYAIECNFKEMYGENFDFLKSQKPHSVMLAEGSEVSVKWKRKPLKLDFI